VGVGEPTADRDCVLGMEYVRGRRVIDNDCLSKVTANLGKVFDIISLMIVTTFPEQPMMDYVMDIKLVK
jgi:hypothetical protein